MLLDDELPIALEDARTRHQSLIDLILFNDQQAMSLLSVYVTLATAAAGLALTTLSAEPLIPMAAAVGLATSVVLLFAASFFCFWAMPPATMALAGEGADFWLWAVREEQVAFKRAALDYLERLNASQGLNRDLNANAGYWLKMAKRLGIVAPIASLIVGVAAYGVEKCWPIYA
jgi:hypothetical protein